MKLIEAIAQNARLLNSETHFSPLHDAAVMRQRRIMDCLPSGSGFDSGTELVSADNTKIVFETGFHHMNENGFYTGWTNHLVYVKPSFIGEYDIRITGRNVNGIKEYIADVFHNVLSASFEWVNK